MTQEEIIDYNKKCADFLGWKYVSSIDVKEQKYDQSIEAGWYCEIPKILHTKINRRLYIGRNHHCLKFHLDWNLIMDVAEAISQLPNKLGGDNYEVNRKVFRFKHLMAHEIIGNKEFFVGKINDFLIWYNDNKTN